jgi:hypothetical protein
LSNARPTNCRLFVADRNHNRIRVFSADTGKEISGDWSAIFASAKCDKPSVWSVRVNRALKSVFVATSNFGAGSACPSVAADAHSGRVAIVPLPQNGSIAEPALAEVGFVDLAHGFPHEICVDPEDGVCPPLNQHFEVMIPSTCSSCSVLLSGPRTLTVRARLTCRSRMQTLYAAAVDSPDLPKGTGIAAITKYTKA